MRKKEYQRFNFGKVKHEVEYDDELLDTYQLFCETQAAKGQGIPTYLYWLINIRRIFIFQPKPLEVKGLVGENKTSSQEPSHP